MRHQNDHSRDKLSPFERQLSQLRPSRSVDTEQLMFAAGQAEAATRLRTSHSRWKTLACCSTVTALALCCGLAASLNSAHQARQSERAMANRLAQPEEASQNFDDWRSSPSDLHVAKRSQYNMRNLLDSAMTDDFATQPRTGRSTRRSSSFSFGDARHVLAVAGERNHLRHIEVLHP